ncbi:MAG: hypothetical protein N3F66_04315 [Spirochaetes bacterium]|nr:hypothetical protein [Spirochaetota bacterium]
MRVLRQLIIQGINIIFLSSLLCMGWTLYTAHIEGNLLVIFIVFSTVMVFPLYTHYIERLYKKIIPLKYEDLYIQTVDSFLSLESFDDIIKEIFDKVLQYIGVRSGLLIFYSHNTDDYTIYYQKQHKQKIIRKAHIDKNNIIFRVIQSSDDILIKSKMDPSLHFQRTIMFEMEKLNGEIIIPIYYHNIFLGLMVIGEMKRRIAKRDILMLKALASKIATVAVNSFFVHELIRSKEIEKEYEMGYKVLKQFMPPDTGVIQNVRYTIVKNNSSATTYYFNIYSPDTWTTYIAVCPLQSKISLLSLQIPAISVLLQSYSRLGFGPDNIIKKINEVLTKKELIENDLPLIIVKKKKKQYCVSRSRDCDIKIYFQKKKRIFHLVLSNKVNQIKNINKLIITAKDLPQIVKESLNIEHLALPDDFTKHEDNFILILQEIV